MSQPETEKTVWIEKENAVVKSDSVCNLSVPRSVKVNWKHRPPNGESETLNNETSLTLKIKNVNRVHSGYYFYEIIANNTVIFVSNETLIEVHCKYNFVAIQKLLNNLRNHYISDVDIDDAGSHMFYRSANYSSYTFPVSQFVKNAYPDVLQFSCFHEGNRLETQQNVAKKDIFFSPKFFNNDRRNKNYTCVFVHTPTSTNKTFTLQLIVGE